MSKTLYIIRGLPGSGKSTLGKQLADTYVDYDTKSGGVKSYSYAADDWFYDKDGVYNFKPEELPQAHADCESRVRGALMSGAENVCVCNTFSTKREGESYIKMAEQFNYVCVIIECQSNFGSIHNVPRSTVEVMKERWEPLLPDWPILR